jgi:hypothetical protein
MGYQFILKLFTLTSQIILGMLFSDVFKTTQLECMKCKNQSVIYNSLLTHAWTMD